MYGGSSLAVALAPGQDQVKQDFLEYRIRCNEEVDENETEEVLTAKILDYTLSYGGRCAFFLDPEGQRFKIGGRIYEFEFYQASRYDKSTVMVTIDTRNFFHQVRTQPIEHVDRGKNREFKKAIRHPAEKGWYLPVGHKHHILSFPLEIQSLIARYVVSVETPRTIRPLVVTSNWKTNAHARCHKVSHPWDGPLIFTRVAKENQIPSHYLVREASAPALDATALRVNSHFFNIGNAHLYAKNTFEFAMPDDARRASPPSTYDGDTLHEPDSRKEDFEEIAGGYANPLFDDAIHQVRTQHRVDQIEGWIYYDHFLRFLHNIGPENAALIKSLKFTDGALAPKTNYSQQYFQDLSNNLKMYVPFIRALCPGLRKLVIEVEEDSNEKEKSDDGDDSEDDEEGRTTEAELKMLSFLENEVRLITSLDELIIFHGPDFDHPAEYAAETSEYVKSQSKERFLREVREERKQLELQKALTIEEVKGKAWNVPKPKVSCGFCGEGHVWPECYNLCQLCGTYGHFRETCRRRPYVKVPKGEIQSESDRINNGPLRGALQ